MIKSTCATCWKKHFEKCLAGTSGSLGCRKDNHNLRDFPTIAARGREAKQVPSNVPEGGAPKRNRFYAL